MNKTPPKSSQSEDDVQILPPDYSIKKKIGMDVDLNTIFTPERIAAAQRAIDDQQSEFIGWAERDLVELDHAYRAMKNDGANIDDSRITKVQKIAFSLKSQAGTFGYHLGSDVADSLYSYMKSHPITADNLPVIEKHVESLKTIFHKNIQGDGKEIGRELKASLNKLIAKFD